MSTLVQARSKVAPLVRVALAAGLVKAMAAASCRCWQALSRARRLVGMERPRIFVCIYVFFWGEGRYYYYEEEKWMNLVGKDRDVMMMKYNNNNNK